MNHDDYLTIMVKHREKDILKDIHGIQKHSMDFQYNKNGYCEKQPNIHDKINSIMIKVSLFYAVLFSLLLALKIK
ncbi:MAG: hypothetical protein MI892_20990 [Desulfobacterales bacterium]|nr:hypothetical protein [Desulfobacterales bacterium]